MPRINPLDIKTIEDNLREFKNGKRETKVEGRKPWARYASFDYCFNYFQSFDDKKALADNGNMEHSCLQLAFYLASWGMLRGSTFLLQKSIRFYQELVIYISEVDADFWQIDVPNYHTGGNIAKLLRCGKDIKLILSNKTGRDKVSDILITKIMLGVFGSVPAFDRYFMLGSGLGTFNETSLRQISHFYKEVDHSEILNQQANDTKTYDFDTGEESDRLYTKAKLIDMIFFIEGLHEFQRRQLLKKSLA